MPVRRANEFSLSGKSIRSMEDFYTEVSRELKFPEHFGRNLDALWDVLTADIAGPIHLIWDDSAVSQQSMGKDFDKICALLKNEKKERDDFQVTFK